MGPWRPVCVTTPLQPSTARTPTAHGVPPSKRRWTDLELGLGLGLGEGRLKHHLHGVLLLRLEASGPVGLGEAALAEQFALEVAPHHLAIHALLYRFVRLPRTEHTHREANDTQASEHGLSKKRSCERRLAPAGRSVLALRRGGSCGCSPLSSKRP